MTIFSTLTTWIEDPEGGGSFPRQRDALRAHDQTCSSLTFTWIPRRKLPASSDDIYECDTCGITFFWEGLRPGPDCPELDHYYCACCEARTPRCDCNPQPPEER